MILAQSEWELFQELDFSFMMYFELFVLIWGFLYSLYDKGIFEIFWGDQ